MHDGALGDNFPIVRDPGGVDIDQNEQRFLIEINYMEM